MTIYTKTQLSTASQKQTSYNIAIIERDLDFLVEPWEVDRNSGTAPYKEGDVVELFQAFRKWEIMGIDIEILREDTMANKIRIGFEGKPAAWGEFDLITGKRTKKTMSLYKGIRGFRRDERYKVRLTLSEGDPKGKIKVLVHIRELKDS